MYVMKAVIKLSPLKNNVFLLCLDFYIAHSKSYSSLSVQVALFGSGILYSKMFLHGRIMEQQKQSIVICIPQTLPMNRMTTGQLRS
jgi:hypothetical protein